MLIAGPDYFGAGAQSEMELMTSTIRNAREGDCESLVEISTRTVRASYTPFLGAEAVEGWLDGGEVKTYFDENLPDCQVVDVDGGIVGFAVAKGASIDLMMIDCNRHREGFGRLLLEHMERQLFETRPLLTLESFAENDRANAFYTALGWKPGEVFEDPADGISKIPFSKRCSAR